MRCENNPAKGTRPAHHSIGDAQGRGVDDHRQTLAKPKEFNHSSIHPDLQFFRGDLGTSLTLDVGEDDTLKPSDQCEHQSLDQCEHEPKE
jgi:hypothetical protein